VREQTLKSVLTLISKLSDRTINGELLKYLAKTANDEQPGIRTNTTICLGKIAKSLGTSSRSKVLIAAFTRSLRDPFVHARNASLMALAVTGEYFSDEDVAVRVLPSICPLLIDKEKLVRDQAVKTMDIYVQRVRKAAASMPETALPQGTTENPGPRMSTPQLNENSAAGSWAGWAISSFTNKLSTAAGEIQPSSNGSSAPAPRMGDAGKKPAPSTTSSASALHRQALRSPPPSAPLSRSSSAAGGDSFFQDPDPIEDDDGDAWGDMNDSGDFFDDGASPPQSPPLSTTATKKKTTVSASRSASGGSTAAGGSAAPFDDGSEPDFAGWLAAQSQKKSGQVLPKGLAKSTPSSNGAKATTAKKPLAAKPAAAKPAPKKTIDMKPKQTDDDDGWGDGW
jgi:SCY1-like protein 1